MRITIVGAGYVGLVTGACLAALGHEVAVVDRDADRIAGLLAGRMPIYEAGLDTLVGDNVAAGRLSFHAELAPAMTGAAAVFICVGTPPRPSDGHADMTGVHQAAGEIAKAIDGFTLVVVKSTVPVGTGDEVEAIIRASRPDADFAVASNPEFLREGVAIDDFMRPDRIVVGVEDSRAGAVMAAVYAPLTAAGAPLVTTNRRAAELVKYAANCFLALKITYINEIANLCEEVGADVEDVSRGIGLDSRIGTKFLKAGPGFGGSCFPKDMLALMKTAQDHGMPLRSVETAVAVNDARKGEMVRKIVRAAGGSLAGKTVAVLGLTFKAETDDMRSAASLVVLPQLLKAGAAVRAYDPAGMANAAPLLPGIQLMANVAEALRGADLAVLMTEWAEFQALDLVEIAHLLRRPVLVDLRNLFEPEAAAAAGLAYHSIGRTARETAARRAVSAAAAGARPQAAE